MVSRSNDGESWQPWWVVATTQRPWCSLPYSCQPNACSLWQTSNIINGCILEKESYLALSYTDYFAGENYAFTCQLRLCLILYGWRWNCSAECQLPPDWGRGFGCLPFGAKREGGVRGGTVGSPASLSLCGRLLMDGYLYSLYSLNLIIYIFI